MDDGYIPPWIGVDLDGTLAERVQDPDDPEAIGPPVYAMLSRVWKWLAEGRVVRVVTARAYPPGDAPGERVQHVHAWLREWVGEDLPVTCCKDPGMEVLYDDRCIQVEPDTGRLVATEHLPSPDNAAVWRYRAERL